jgi:hypothetical protein
MARTLSVSGATAINSSRSRSDGEKRREQRHTAVFHLDESRAKAGPIELSLLLQEEWGFANNPTPFGDSGD